MLLKISQVSQKTPVLESLFYKAADLKACKFIKKRFQHISFPVKFANFPGNSFSTEHLRWLRLNLHLLIAFQKNPKDVSFSLSGI